MSQDVPEVDIGPNTAWNFSKLNLALQDHYACKQAINLWQGPRHPNYNSLIERVRSFENVDWSEKPSACRPGRSWIFLQQ